MTLTRQLLLLLFVLVACEGVEHPPPVGEGGDEGEPIPPILLGGSDSSGPRGGASGLGGVRNNAGNGGRDDGPPFGGTAGNTFGGASNSFGGASSSFGGASSSFGGASSSFGGASSSFGGASSSFGGASSSFGGSFSTGGL